MVFSLAWLMVGFLFAVVVFGQVRIEAHRMFALLFFLAIILLGPLNFLMTVVPDSLTESWTRNIRNWMDRNYPEKETQP